MLYDGGGFGKNLIMLGADSSSSVHIDNKKKLNQRIDDTTLTTEKKILGILLRNRRNFV